MKRINLFECKISKESKIDGHMLDSIHEDYYILLIAQKKFTMLRKCHPTHRDNRKREFRTLTKNRYFGKFSLREDVD